MIARSIRVVLLGLLAVLTSSIAGSLIALLFAQGLFGNGDWDFLISFALPSLIVGAIPLVAVGLIVVGLPVDWVLGRIGARTASAYGLCGAVGGGMLGAALGLGDAFAPAGLVALIGAIYGLVTALLGWWAFRAASSECEPA